MFGRSGKCLLAVLFLILAPLFSISQTDRNSSGAQIVPHFPPRIIFTPTPQPAPIFPTPSRAARCLGIFRDGSRCGNDFFRNGHGYRTASGQPRTIRRDGSDRLSHRERDSRRCGGRESHHFPMDRAVVERTALSRGRTCAAFSLSAQQTGPNQLCRWADGPFRYRRVGTCLALRATGFGVPNRFRPWWEVARGTQRFRLGGAAGR